MDALEVVNRFGRHVDAASASVFIGAGLSIAAGYPGWAQLLEPLRLELDIPPIEDLPQLAQYFADAAPGGRGHLERRIRSALEAVGTPPTPSHVLLSQLPVTEIWTTNYDSLIERAVADAHVFVADTDLAGTVEPGKRRVYKMHGSLDPPSAIVLTRDDYEQYPWTHPRFWALLQAQFLTRSFLFLGFSFTDPNMEVVFRLVRVHASDAQREHFAVLRQPDGTGDPGADAQVQKLFELRVKDLNRVGVQVLVTKAHAEIESLLQRLVARCRPSQAMVCGSSPGTVHRAGPGPSYPTAPLPREIEDMARAIGTRLSDTEVRLVAAGEAGALVGYEMLRQLNHRGLYRPERFTLVRRVRDEPLDPPNRRLGDIIFTGEQPNDLRSSALRQVRALLVLGGSDGTLAEVEQAEAVGLGIVPVGVTGGTAEAVWQRMRSDLGLYVLGGRPIDARDFDLLMNPDLDAAAAAAVRLLCQAVFLA